MIYEATELIERLEPAVNKNFTADFMKGSLLLKVIFLWAQKEI
jgi:hypothetical protein